MEKVCPYNDSYSIQMEHHTLRAEATSDVNIPFSMYPQEMTRARGDRLIGWEQGQIGTGPRSQGCRFRVTEWQHSLFVYSNVSCHRLPCIAAGEHRHFKYDIRVMVRIGTPLREKPQIRKPAVATTSMEFATSETRPPNSPP